MQNRNSATPSLFIGVSSCLELIEILAESKSAIYLFLFLEICFKFNALFILFILFFTIFKCLYTNRSIEIKNLLSLSPYKFS